jgi:DNA-binding MarR family transcriptional regulator
MTAPGLNSEFAEPDESAGLMLWRVTNIWQAAQRRALKPFGLTHVQFVLLASLTWIDADVPVTQQALATHAGTDPMMTSQVLRTLEKAGLVERKPHPQDGRARLLAVTAEGRARANSANAAVERCDREFFGRLGGDSATFTTMLGRLIA